MYVGETIGAGCSMICCAVVERCKLLTATTSRTNAISTRSRFMIVSRQGENASSDAIERKQLGASNLTQIAQTGKHQFERSLTSLHPESRAISAQRLVVAMWIGREQAASGCEGAKAPWRTLTRPCDGRPLTHES